MLSGISWEKKGVVIGYMACCHMLLRVCITAVSAWIIQSNKSDGTLKRSLVGWSQMFSVGDLHLTGAVLSSRNST